MSSRRKFLRTSALTLTASGFYPLLTRANDQGFVAPQPDSLQLGIAGYTFHNIPMDQGIAMMQRVGVSALSIKDFYLPLDSSPEKIEEVLGKFRAAGIQVYAAGVIYMKTEGEVDRAFDYAKKIGVNMIVGVPDYELLPYAEQKVKSSNIRLAIHNHGPEDKLYPAPKDVFDRIRNMDGRIGLCFDIGHGARAGADPARSVIEFAPRIFDLHVKDISAAGTGERAIEIGRGIIDFPALVRALKKIKFAGRCSIEFEMDTKDPLPGIAESVGFFRGVVKTLA
ncbi:MAG TPA: sugar phosphate isomerase/epimerase [Puia sp.]|nr:sugar phosphate isomerase/epimerase [Puia sp.]